MDKLKQGIQGCGLPHPSVQISMWIALALLSQSLQGLALLALAAAVLVLSLAFGVTRLLTLLRRTRWIFFTLLLIYAYAMPGEAWFAQLGAFSPSREGVLDGLLQIMRLATALAGLAIVLTVLSTEQLIAGLYCLAYPLRYLGVSRERIAVRLALTLRYAEQAMLHSARDGMRSLDDLMTPMQGGQDHIELQLEPLTRRDWLLLLATGLLLVGVWL